MRLAGQVAMVIGGSSGVGRAIALGLMGEGATVCVVGRRADALDAIAGRQPAGCPAPVHYPADLTLDADLRGLAERAARDFAGLDILVHSAGLISIGPLDAAPVESFDAQFRVNLRAPYLLTKLLLQSLRARCGQVVFINSSAGLSAGAGVAQYAATKHGLKAVADSLRHEVNAYGVRVTSVFLGRTATPMQERLHALEDREYRPDPLIQPQEVAALVIAGLVLPRTAEITDVSIRPMRKP